MEKQIDPSVLLSDVIKTMHQQIEAQVDKEWIRNNLGPIFSRLEDKKRQGTLNLFDFRDLLRIYKNILIPAAKKQIVNKLQSIESIAKASKNGSMGIG